MNKIHQLFALVLAPVAIGSVVAYSQPAHAALLTYTESGDATNSLPGVATGVSLASGDFFNLNGLLSGADTDVFQFTYSGPTPGALTFGLSSVPDAASVAYEIYKGATFIGSGFDPKSGLPIGIFNPGDVISVKFAQSVPTDTAYGAQFSATAVAVPTPALLPGLVGLGAAAWRKRKSEKAAVAA